jgi:acetyl esterase
VPVHADVAARFPYLDGLTSLGEAYADPVLIQQIRRFETWDPAVPVPAVHIRGDSAPGPHGPVPVRIYTPSAAPPAGAPCLVWLHGGGFIGGDLDMQEADWTAAGGLRRRRCRGGQRGLPPGRRGVCYPVPHDDTWPPSPGCATCRRPRRRSA